MESASGVPPPLASGSVEPTAGGGIGRDRVSTATLVSTAHWQYGSGKGARIDVANLEHWLVKIRQERGETFMCTLLMIETPQPNSPNPLTVDGPAPWAGETVQNPNERVGRLLTASKPNSSADLRSRGLTN